MLRKWLIALLLVLVAGAGLAALLGREPEDRPAGVDRAAILPIPPGSLRDLVPDELDWWVRPGLVLVYRNGSVYHLFSEGVMGHSCPFGAQKRDPEACFSTAQHVVWDRSTPDAMSVTGGDDLELREPPEDADVLWRGVPYEGSIGVRTPGACARIARFEGDYECKNGVAVYVRGEAQNEVFFPTWDTSHGVPQALLEDATLVRHDGCLFARVSTGDAEALLVWPNGFRLGAAGDQVLDASGRFVFTVGDTLRLGGGYTPNPSAAEELIGQRIPAACRSPGESVWLVGEIPEKVDRD